MSKAIPAGARILMDLIYRTETGRAPPDCYTTIIGHREKTLQKPITAMTLDELLAAQRTWGKKWRSSAAGAPQIIRPTMQNLVTRMALSGREKYTSDLQDRMAFTLLLWRGWETFAAGRMSITKFGDALAKEWASFPVLTAQQGAHGKLKRGQSYYDGDGMNSALIKPAEVEATLQRALKAAQQPGEASSAPEAPKFQPAPQPPPAPAPGPIVVEKPVVADPEELEKHPLKSKTVWQWIITSIIVPLMGVFSDRYVQLAIIMIVAAFAVYAIKRRWDLFSAVKNLKAALE